MKIQLYICKNSETQRNTEALCYSETRQLLGETLNTLPQRQILQRKVIFAVSQILCIKSNFKKTFCKKSIFFAENQLFVSIAKHLPEKQTFGINSNTILS